MEGSKESRYLYSRYGGSWEVKENLMCWKHDKIQMVKLDMCVTVVLDGDIATWYKTSGFAWYNRYRTIKLISGTPKNL